MVNATAPPVGHEVLREVWISNVIRLFVGSHRRHDPHHSLGNRQGKAHLTWKWHPVSTLAPMSPLHWVGGQSRKNSIVISMSSPSPVIENISIGRSSTSPPIIISAVVVAYTQSHGLLQHRHPWHSPSRPQAQHVVQSTIALSGTPVTRNIMSASSVKALRNASSMVTVAMPVPPLVRIESIVDSTTRASSIEVMTSTFPETMASESPETVAVIGAAAPRRSSRTSESV